MTSTECEKWDTFFQEVLEANSNKNVTFTSSINGRSYTRPALVIDLLLTGEGLLNTPARGKDENIFAGLRFEDPKNPDVYYEINNYPVNAARIFFNLNNTLRVAAYQSATNKRVHEFSVPLGLLIYAAYNNICNFVSPRKYIYDLFTPLASYTTAVRAAFKECLDAYTDYDKRIRAVDAARAKVFKAEEAARNKVYRLQELETKLKTYKQTLR